MDKNRMKKIFKTIFIVVIGLTLAACKPSEIDDNQPTYTVEDITTDYTDSFHLATNYNGKRFLTHGIGAVSLVRVVDGDTAHFEQPGVFGTIKVRFLGIDTPESTIRIAPWGLKASDFVTEKLESAYEIVLEANEVGKRPPVDATGDRYLGYVWYRSSKESPLRLLNLEIIEECYSYFTGSEDIKYSEVFRLAFTKAYDMSLRVFGEEDPDFTYSTQIFEITIAELRKNFSKYSKGATLKIQAKVMRKVGKSLYIEDLEDSFDEATGEYSKAGIFLYHAFTSGLEAIENGDIIEFNCQATDAKEYGTQLTNPHKIRIKESGKETIIRDVDESVRILEQYEGLVVRVRGVEITSRGRANAENGAFTVKGILANGAEIQIRIDGDVTPKPAHSNIIVGKKYDIIGGVSKYIDVYDNNKIYYQIKPGNVTEETLSDFILSE